MIVVPFVTPAEQGAAIPAIVRHLEDGGIIAYPTETVYGLGCALLAAPLDTLARMKRRESGRPFLLLVHDAAQAPGLEWTRHARALASAFWPGPLTLALRADTGAYPREVAATGTVAIRATPHGGLRALLGALGAPITSTSANVPGKKPALTAADALVTLEKLDAPGDSRVLDGGALEESPPSTLVDCAAARPRVLREGAIPAARLRQVVKEIDV